MHRPVLIILVILGVILTWLGIRNLQRIDKNNEAFISWQKDTARYNQQLSEQKELLRNLKPSQELIQPRENTLPGTLADPYLSASQGVEVHLEGIRWMGHWFNPVQSHGIEKLGGRAEVQINQIIFDPDFEKAGMPDMNVEVTAPRFFKMRDFLSDWLEGFQLTGFLGKAFGEKKPVESYDLETTDGKKRKMSLWLLEFDAFLRIEPSPDHNNDNVGGLDRHPVSGIRTSEIRRDQEAKNQRYGNVSVMLKFKPKDGTWYIADRDESGMLVPDGGPKIGIAAVECIGIKPVSENKNLNNIGVYLRRGSSLALYNSPGEIDNKFNTRGIELDNTLMSVEETIYREGTMYNPDFFGKEKYAIIHLTNMGSWQEGSWFSSISRYADVYEARFVIHTYVMGEWNVQPLKIAEPEARPAYEQKKAGFLDFVLPDFNLGWFGRLLSGGGWIIIGFIVLGVFFPPVMTLVNKVFGWVVALVPSAKKP